MPTTASGGTVLFLTLATLRMELMGSPSSRRDLAGSAKSQRATVLLGQQAVGTERCARAMPFKGWTGFGIMASRHECIG